MKILHVINNLGSGGAEKLIEQFVPLMNEKEHVQADVLLLTDVGNVFDEHLKDNDVNITVVPLRNPKNPLNVFYLKRHIVHGNYDVVHAHLFPTFYWVSIVSRLMIRKDKPRFILTEHSTHNRRREKSILRPLERYIYSSFDRVISVSEKTHQNLIEWLGLVDDDRFVVIPNGVNISHFSEAIAYQRWQLNTRFTEKTKLICMVGRFSEAKDQKTVIRSLEHLPQHIHLLLVGEGPLIEEHKRLVMELNLEERVHFLGFRKDVSRILKTVDIVVLSSHWEGLPLVAVEGMATGKPVLASDVSGLSEIVKDYGILFEKGNHDELSEVLNRLLVDGDEYDKVSVACSARANNFDMAVMVENYLTVYQKCSP